MVKSNSKNKLLKFWTLFIKSNDDDADDDADTAQEQKESDKQDNNQESPTFVIADCCKPIPGASVVGFKDPITHQIIVHKASCDELNRLASQHGECIMKEEIQWSQCKKLSPLSKIEILGIDRMGLLLDLANVVTNDFSINMREVNIQSHDGIFEGTLSLYVRDAESLNALLERLRRIKGMETVKRVLN